MSPGSLAVAHAHLSGLAACTECHAPLRGTPDALCIECHEDVGRRMHERIGVHGALEGACADCHVEHRGADGDLLGFDRETFNHDRALFVLRGAHREAECESCHRRAHPETGREAFHAQGIDFERCDACHEDAHGDAFLAGRDCAVCHGESNWTVEKAVARADGEAGFDHDLDTAFPLLDRHRSVDCRACHTEERRAREKSEASSPGRGAPDACRSCHEDVHRDALGDGCEHCHTASAWQGPDAPFDHARHTEFALDPLHRSLACASCHADERFQAEATDCAGCHPDAAALLAGRFDDRTGEADPHQERVTCQRCHAADEPGMRLTDHGRACLDCHNPPYGALLLARQGRLDELVVAAEGLLRSQALAARRGETITAVPADSTGERIERLARSGAHNPSLAERILREELARLESLRGGRLAVGP